MSALKKNLVPLLGISVLSLGLVVTVILTSQKQEIRSRAAETSNTVQETIYDYDAKLKYDGSWAKYEPGPFNLNFHYKNDTQTPGGSISMTFVGKSITYYFSKYPQGGTVEVLIDGAKIGEIDQYAPEFTWNQKISYELANNASHNLVIKGTDRKNPNSTGFSFNIHALEITKIIEPLGSGTYDDDNENINYSGTWTLYNGSGPYKDTLHYSNDTSASFSLYFTGTSVTYTYTKAYNRDIYEVYIDDKKMEEIDAYSPGIVWQQKKTYTGLTDGPHTLIIKNTGRKNPASSDTYIDVDGILVESGTQPPVGQIYDDYDSNISYKGSSWRQIQTSQYGFYKDTVHFTTNSGDSASFSFTGKQINYIYTKYPNRGIAEIYIDGNLQKEVDAYAPSIVSQVKLDLTGLSDRPHIIKIVNSGRKNPASSDIYIDVDGFETIKPDQADSCTIKDFKAAFIVLAKDQTEVDQAKIAALNQIKSEVSRDFVKSTLGLATMDVSYDVKTMVDNPNDSFFPGGQTIDDYKVARKFYETNPDDFHFLFIYTFNPLPAPSLSAYFSGVRNRVKGIGRDIFDNGSSAGSKEKLLGIIVMENGVNSYTNPSMGYHFDTLHEVAHQWCCYAGDSAILNWNGIHWNDTFSLNKNYVDPMFSKYFIPDGNGLYHIDPANDIYASYHPFQLYYMGLLKPEDITEEFWLYDNRYDAHRVKSYRISDIIASAGERSCQTNSTSSQSSSGFGKFETTKQKVVE